MSSAVRSHIFVHHWGCPSPVLGEGSSNRNQYPTVNRCPTKRCFSASSTAAAARSPISMELLPLASFTTPSVEVRYLPVRLLTGGLSIDQPTISHAGVNTDQRILLAR